MSKNSCRVVLACRVMRPELEYLKKQDDSLEVRYIDQGLHRTPKKMPEIIQEQVDQVAEYAERIVLGYGLCSYGIEGVRTCKQEIVVPKAHDCIALFLGSLEAYDKAFHTWPGTYYLTTGWVAEQKDPLGILSDEYMSRFDRDTAVWVMSEELKNYTHIALIKTGLDGIGPLRERAIENARFFKKEYQEIEGSLQYFKKLLFGPYTGDDFFVIKPGETITKELFMNDILNRHSEKSVAS